LGYQIEVEGLGDSADSFYSRTINLLERLRSEKGLNLTEQAFAELAISHGHRLFKLGKFPAANQAFERAVETLDAMRDRGISMDLIEQLASAYHWCACSHRKLNQLKEAREDYHKAVGLLHSLLCFSSDRKRDFKVRVMADGVTMGFQKTLKELGEID
jgi:tetratricopeptide (TPR) repeat protein